MPRRENPEVELSLAFEDPEPGAWEIYLSLSAANTLGVNVDAVQHLPGHLPSYRDR